MESWEIGGKLGEKGEMWAVWVKKMREKSERICALGFGRIVAR